MVEPTQKSNEKQFQELFSEAGKLFVSCENRKAESSK